MQPLIDKLLQSQGPERTAVQNQIEGLGLAALPGVARRLQKTMNKTERAVLEPLVQRLACTVEEVVIAENSLKPDKMLGSRLDAIKGKPLDPGEFIGTIEFLAKNLPKGVHALRFGVDSAGNGTGVSA
jgi:hypothetical protein